MKNLVICAALVGWAGTFCTAALAAERMLSHDVYFALKDNSLGARKELVAGCKEFLSDHPGTVWFSAGMLVKELDRDVNDRDFDVALHIVFKDKPSHDKYQQADRHHKFIAEFKKDGATYPYDIIYFRQSMGDNAPLAGDLPEFVRDWNSKHPYPKLVIATTAAMFREFERRYGDVAI